MKAREMLTCFALGMLSSNVARQIAMQSNMSGYIKNQRQYLHKPKEMTQTGQSNFLNEGWYRA